jgi:hypothetical protein
MKHRMAIGASLGLMLLAGSVLAGETLKSGPQIGDKIFTPFNPLNLNGRAAGQKACQV